MYVYADKYNQLKKLCNKYGYRYRILNCCDFIGNMHVDILDGNKFVACGCKKTLPEAIEQAIQETYKQINKE